ncbi:MAG: Maf family protein [Pseudomonadota bacterium]
MAPKLILASQSPRRLDLLAQIGIVPDEVIPAHIDERRQKSEPLLAFVDRLAREKAEFVAQSHANAVILGADTIVHTKAHHFDKANTRAEAAAHLHALSGRRHRVTTSVCLLVPVTEEPRARLSRRVTSIVKLKRLSDAEIEGYLTTREWEGKAGGYAIQGCAARFVANLSGSYSAVVGLPLYETSNLLQSANILPPAGP